MEAALFVAGCGGAAALASSLLPRVLANHSLSHVPITAAMKIGTGAKSTSGELIGELRIPAVGLSTPVLEDCTPQTLRKGSCHMTGTASIGGLGTTAIAGHRDASFRVLQAVKAGNPIAINTSGGTYFYSIDQTRIVAPEEVDVLAIRDRPGLVLITCYPFHYVGPAPKRFVVEAHLLSAAPI